MATPESPAAEGELEGSVPASPASPLTVTIPATTTTNATTNKDDESMSQQPSSPPPPPVSPVFQQPPSSSHASKAPLSPNHRRVSKRIKIRRKSRPIPKIFHDAISVIIPLDVTVDLKVAMEHTRAKRIQSIYKRFPSLKKAVKKWKHSQELQITDDAIMDEDDDASNNNNTSTTKDANSDGKENNKPLKKKKKVLAHVPQPEQYGSVIDYLEAKYVRGVMLGDEDGDGESMDDGSEGQGSVYSAGSFLDDTDLQRDVAEQVMANTTLTKLELENEDGEFFVNVGALEVEENQYGDNYDPLQDTEVSTKTTKKRKKSQQQPTTEATPLGQSLVKKSKKQQEDNLAQSSKTAKSTASTGSQKKKASTITVETETTSQGALDDEEHESEEHEELLAKVKKAKAKSDGMFKKLANLVKQMKPEDLPRRKTKLKVSLTCPPNKKPGDDVTFTNPHNKTQRLRVKVPKDCFPGGTFKVSVPVKHDPAEGDGEEKDHNTFSREFQELLDDYARAHDDWCSAQAAVDKTFALLKEKQAKFDPLIELFPENLLTPVTIEYMKKIVRRARQNRHKRKKNAAMKGDASIKDADDDEGGEESDREDGGGTQDDTMNDEESVTETTQKRIVEIPTMGSQFPKIKFSEADFGN